MNYVTVSLNNNKAVFYFQGFDDKNFISIKEYEEHYYRKATIELNNNSIVLNI